MPSTSYVDGDGLKKNRKVRGNGDTTTPYEGYVVDDDLNTATGTQAQAPAVKSTLATTGATPYSIIQLLKGILLNLGTETQYTEFASGVISVGTTLTTVVTVDVRNFRRMNIQIQNTGATALNAFSVQGRYNSGLGGFYNPRASTTADFTTNRALQTGNSTAFVLDASADLTVLAGSGSGWLELNVERYESIQIQATVASGTTNLRIDGIAKNI